MSVYFRHLSDKEADTYAATTSAGSFLATCTKRQDVWEVATGPSSSPNVRLKAPSLEEAFQYVREVLAGSIDVK